MVDEQKLVSELWSLIRAMKSRHFIELDEFDEDEGRIERGVRLFELLVECGVDTNSLTALKGQKDEHYDAALKRYEVSLLSPEARADEPKQIQGEVMEKRVKDYPHKGSDALWDFFNTF